MKSGLEISILSGVPSMMKLNKQTHFSQEAPRVAAEIARRFPSSRKRRAISAATRASARVTYLNKRTQENCNVLDPSGSTRRVSRDRFEKTKPKVLIRKGVSVFERMKRTHPAKDSSVVAAVSAAFLKQADASGTDATTGFEFGAKIKEQTHLPNWQGGVDGN